MKTITNRILPFKGFSAITLWPFIFVRSGARFSARTERHECIHGCQQVEMLLLPFYLWYGAEFLVRWLGNGFDANAAYRNISFEQEAYGHDADEAYLANRRHYAWLKYVGRSTYNNAVGRA